jgi:predicted RNase H-like HicB family nuclease
MSTLHLQTVVYREGEHYVAQCLNIDVSSFGDTEAQALTNLREALELYFEDAPASDAAPVEAAEHERPDARLRVRSFPATADPTGTTTSADFSTASNDLPAITVAYHPTISAEAPVGHPTTPMETSRDKTSHHPRAPAAFT